MVQIPVFSYCLIPNSISFSIAYSIAYSYCLIPITFVFTLKVGLLIRQSQKMSVEAIEKEIEFGIGQYENRGICTLESPNGTNPCVFILPNSKFYFLFYCLFYCLFLLPNSDYLCFYSQSGAAHSTGSKT